MARGRLLNRSVSASLKFHNLSNDTCRLMASWIIPHLDLNGVFYADPVMVKSTIFPRRGDITFEDVEGYLCELENAGLMYRFVAKEDRWQCWEGFAHNQPNLRRDREAALYPLPPDMPAPIPSDDDDDAAATPPDARDNPAPIPPDDDDDTPAIPAEENLRELNLELKRIPYGATAAAPPPTPPPRSQAAPPKPKRKKPPKPPLHPAIKEFRRATFRFPSKAWYDEVARIVGDEKADLALWYDICFAWVGLGWNPTNVRGMLDFYDRREIPKGGNRAMGPPGGSTVDRMLALGEDD